jgi:hypothetical protein
VDNEYSETVDGGIVISQSVVAGTIIGQGETIYLVVSLGAELVTIPDFVGLDQDVARELVESLNLNLGRIINEYSAVVDEGLVMSQSLAVGDSVNPNTSIDLTISLGVLPPSVSPFNIDVWGEDFVITLERDDVTVDVPIPPWVNLEESLQLCAAGCCLIIYERDSHELMTMVEISLLEMPEDESFKDFSEKTLVDVVTYLRGLEQNSEVDSLTMFEGSGELSVGLVILEYPEIEGGELIPITEIVKINEYEGIVIRTRLRARSVGGPEAMSADEFADAFGVRRYVDAGYIILDE